MSYNSFGLAFVSFKDVGLVVLSKIGDVPIVDDELNVVVNYYSVILNHCRVGELYGPYPLPKLVNHIVYIFPMKLIDPTVKDPRVHGKNRPVPCFLVLFSKSHYKPIIQLNFSYFNAIFKKYATGFHNVHEISEIILKSLLVELWQCVRKHHTTNTNSLKNSLIGELSKYITLLTLYSTTSNVFGNPITCVYVVEPEHLLTTTSVLTTVIHSALLVPELISSTNFHISTTNTIIEVTSDLRLQICTYRTLLSQNHLTNFTSFNALGISPNALPSFFNFSKDMWNVANFQVIAFFQKKQTNNLRHLINYVIRHAPKNYVLAFEKVPSHIDVTEDFSLTLLGLNFLLEQIIRKIVNLLFLNAEKEVESTV